MGNMDGHDKDRCRPMRRHAMAVSCVCNQMCIILKVVYGSFILLLIQVEVRPYMYARPAAALWNCDGMAPTWASTGSHRSRQDSLTLCLRSDCHKRQNSFADGAQNSRDNGVPTDAYMYGPLKDTKKGGAYFHQRKTAKQKLAKTGQRCPTCVHVVPTKR